MDWWTTDWTEELITFKYKPQPELPEDILFMMLKKYPNLQQFIEKYDLQLEY